MSAELVIEPDPVNAGAPITITYRFRALPGAVDRLDPERRANVRFVDDEGEALWSDDHWPPVPTTEWRPGEVVTYTRSLLVPVDVPPGPVEILLELSDPAVDRAVTLQVQGRAVNSPASVASLEILPEPLVSALPRYGEGWHEPGPNGRWNRGEGRLYFARPHGETVLHLEIDGRPDIFDLPQVVEILVAGNVVDSFPLRTNQPYRRLIPLLPSQLGTENPVEVLVRADRTFDADDLRRDPDRWDGSRGVRLRLAALAHRPDARPPSGLGPSAGTAPAYRWTGRRAVIYGPPDATSFSLTLRSAAPFPQTVRVLVSGEPVEEMSLSGADAGWITRDFPVPRPRDGLVRAELLVDPVMEAADGPGGVHGVQLREYAWSR